MAPASDTDRDPARSGCPLCRSQNTEPFCEVDGRSYRRCPVCALRFLDPARRPDRATEAAHYARHRNHPDDPAYRRFLARLAEPLLERLRPASAGLDFGCGPGPALAAMLTEGGHRVALYDPMFQPDEHVLEDAYDFVTCTEVAEHLHDPAGVFERLRGLVRPGGLLAVMTCFQTEDRLFADWHYRRDPTHVVFYREATFRWLAASRDWCCEVPRKNVVLMRKPPSG